MNSTIPREEGIALTLLSVFGALKLENLNYALSCIGNEKNNYWYLNRMVRQMKIFTKDGYYLATPRSEPKERRNRVFWVLMQYIDDIEIATIQREASPEGISFLMSNKFYRIIIGSPVPDTTTDLINDISNKEVNCIIVISDDKTIEEYKEINKKHCFAIVKPVPSSEHPEVDFFSTKAPIKAEAIAHA